MAGAIQTMVSAIPGYDDEDGCEGVNGLQKPLEVISSHTKQGLNRAEETCLPAMLGLSREAKVEEANWFQSNGKDRRAHRRPLDGRILTFLLEKI